MSDHLAEAVKHAESLLTMVMKTPMSERDRVQIVVAAIHSTSDPWKLAGVLASERICNIILKALGAPQFDTRELATILAALRYWQREGASGNSVDTEPEHDILTDGGEIEPLTAEEIDALCERINQ